MTGFIAGAVALSVVVLGLILRPLLFDRAAGATRRTLAGLALVVPVAAAGLYAVLGNTEALADHAATPAVDPQVQKMVTALAAKLERDPSNQKGWVMLARSYKVMGRPVDAERAYERAGDVMDNDAQELANYADVIATNADGQFNQKATRLLAKALHADPKNTMALWLAGNAAYQGGDAKGAVDVWRKLLALLPPDSDDARELRGAIAQAGG